MILKIILILLVLKLKSMEDIISRFESLNVFIPKEYYLKKYIENVVSACNLNTVHGIDKKKTIEIIKDILDNPKLSIQTFYDYYNETKKQFEKRDLNLIVGKGYIPSNKEDIKKLWFHMNRARDCCIAYIEENDKLTFKMNNMKID